MHGRNSRGFTLMEVMVVSLIIGILTSIATPQFLSSRSMSRQRSCIANLRQINSAKDQWAMAANLSTGDPVAQADLAPDFIRKWPTCPAGGTYTINAVSVNAACSLNAGKYPHKL